MSSGFGRAAAQRALTLGLAGILALLGSACSTAHYAVNAPSARPTADERGYALRNLKGNSNGSHNSDSLVVVLAFSGGGYRAAALTHAVIAALADTPIQWEGRRGSLLDEVDVMSAVSGGSLAVAYFALHPDTFLEAFPRQVLAKDLQSLMWQRTLSPAGLWRQTSKTYGRGDLLQEVLDEQVFLGRRFAAIPRHRPMVYINATDMRHGQRFEFSQDQFDHLCSDLNEFPLARAVAASMAVPVLFSPITLWNHRQDCPAPRALRPVSGQAARSRYVHLVDGGLADNTGLNAVLDNVAVNGGLRRVEQAVRLHGVRKRVFITVNAAVTPPDPQADSPNTPGLVRQLRSLVSVPIDRHADAKVQNLSEAVRQWQAELRETGDPGSRNVADAFHIVELNMSRARDPELAARLQRIPTGLRLEPEQLLSIRQFVREELALNPQWQRLLADLAPSRSDTERLAMD